MSSAAAPVQGHGFCGFYFAYPSEPGQRGLVSSVQDEPPMLNWIYVHADTGRLEHGARKDTLGHVVGPWGWSADEAFLTLRGARGGFVARREPLHAPARGARGGDGAQGRREGEGDDDEAWGLYWEEQGDAHGGQEGPVQGKRQAVMLRRRPLLGMESSYVRGGRSTA